MCNFFLSHLTYFSLQLLYRPPDRISVGILLIIKEEVLRTARNIPGIEFGIFKVELFIIGGLWYYSAGTVEPGDLGGGALQLRRGGVAQDVQEKLQENFTDFSTISGRNSIIKWVVTRVRSVQYITTL